LIFFAPPARHRGKKEAAGFLLSFFGPRNQLRGQLFNQFTFRFRRRSGPAA